MGALEKITAGKKIGAAIRRPEDLEEALRHPNVGGIFLLGGDVLMLPEAVKRARAAGKVLVVHVDLLAGAGKDRAGIGLLKRMGVSCLVTTKSGLVKAALDEGITVVQRLFVVDSEALKTGLRVAGSVRPDAVEILPATVPRYVVEEIKEALGLPVLAGGLLRTEDDVREALRKGIDAVSTSRRNLWDIEPENGL
jgi:glycerol uptake operon antiterminator